MLFLLSVPAEIWNYVLGWFSPLPLSSKVKKQKKMVMKEKKEDRNVEEEEDRNVVEEKEEDRNVKKRNEISHIHKCKRCFFSIFPDQHSKIPTCIMPNPIHQCSICSIFIYPSAKSSLPEIPGSSKETTLVHTHYHTNTHGCPNCNVSIMSRDVLYFTHDCK